MSSNNKDPNLTPFALGNYELALHTSGWTHAPRYKACFSETEEKPDEELDGVGKEKYKELLDKASSTRGAYFMGVMKFETSDPDVIPAAFNDRVESRINKGKQDDQKAEQKRKQQKCKSTRKRPAAARGPRSILKKQNKTWIDMSSASEDESVASEAEATLPSSSSVVRSDMPPPAPRKLSELAQTKKRASWNDLTSVDLGAMRPLAHELEKCEARLVAADGGAPPASPPAVAGAPEQLLSTSEATRKRAMIESIVAAARKQGGEEEKSKRHRSSKKTANVTATEELPALSEPWEEHQSVFPSPASQPEAATPMRSEIFASMCAGARADAASTGLALESPSQWMISPSPMMNANTPNEWPGASSSRRLTFTGSNSWLQSPTLSPYSSMAKRDLAHMNATALIQPSPNSSNLVDWVMTRLAESTSGSSTPAL